MRNKKLEGGLLIISGLIIIGAAFYIYFFVDKTYPGSTSSRVQDLNWLLRTFGKTGTAVLFTVIGVIPLYFGGKKFGGK